jgi:hypothetical protein
MTECSGSGATNFARENGFGSFQPKLHNGEQNMKQVKSLGTGTVA